MTLRAALQAQYKSLSSAKKPKAQYKSLSSAKKPKNHVFPHKSKTETLEQKPIQPVTTITILKFWGENKGTRESSLFSSQPLSISSSWVEISNLYYFYTFFSILLLAFFISFLLKHH